MVSPCAGFPLAECEGGVSLCRLPLIAVFLQIVQKRRSLSGCRNGSLLHNRGLSSFAGIHAVIV